MIKLGERFGSDALERACRQAIAVDLYDIKRLRTILLQAIEHDDQEEVEALPAPERYARPGAAFCGWDRIQGAERNRPMTVNDLTPLLKRLKLGQMLPTLPERIALARRDSLDYVAFLEVILSDEVNRRDVKRLRTRLEKAGFEQICSLEDFDWGAEISMDKRLVDAVFALEFLSR